MMDEKTKKPNHFNGNILVHFLRHSALHLLFAKCKNLQFFTKESMACFELFQDFLHCFLRINKITRYFMVFLSVCMIYISIKSGVLSELQPCLYLYSTSSYFFFQFLSEHIVLFYKMLYEPPHQKSNNLHMRKQRRRSAVPLCFRFTDSTISLLRKALNHLL